MQVKRIRIFSAILGIFLVGSLIWGYREYRLEQNYRTYLQNQYQKSFYELADHVGNLETKLSKLMVTAAPKQNILLLNDIWRQSNAAEMNLGQLPLAHLSLNKTAQFINQLGDFCYYLSRNAADGKPASRNDMERLKKLHDNSILLNNELKNLVAKSGQKDLDWIAIRNQKPQQVAKSPVDARIATFTKIEKMAADYPSLIYDGPFSSSMDKIEPKGLGTKDVSPTEAQTIATNFFGKDMVRNISKAGELNGPIKAWGFTVTSNNQNHKQDIYVTKKGGHVLWMMEEATTYSRKLTVEQCAKLAEDFLKAKGFPDITATYRQYYDGITVINYADKQNNIILYPDLIKVKISMEDGHIIGYDAQNYLVSHVVRQLPKPKLTEAQVRAMVSGNLKIQSIRLALIPTDTRGEKLCYECKGSYGKDNFIVYINAVTGKEENILKIIDTINGNLIL